MEDLVRGLRNLGLQAPSPAQLLEILDDDPEVRRRLVRLLAFSAFEVGGDGDGDGVAGSSAAAAALMGQDLLQEAVTALLENFSAAVTRQRDVLRRERDIVCAARRNDAEQKENDQDALQPNGSALRRETGKGKRQEEAKRVKLPPRKALLARQDAALRRVENERKLAHTSYGGYRPRLVFDGQLAFTSKAPLDSLLSIICRDLRFVPRRYNGAVLVCRVISHVLPYIGATFVVEDVNADAITVSVSHFSRKFTLSVEDASCELPVGTMVAIKEPFVSMDHQARAGPCSGKSDIGIRIDSPTDLVVLDYDHPSALHLLQQSGWKSKTASALWPATAIPSWLGLRHLSHQRAHTTRDKLQQVHELLTNERPGAAWRMLQRIKSANEICDGNKEALLLEAQILYQLKEWKKAEVVFNTIANVKQSETGTGVLKARTLNFATPQSELYPEEAMQRSILRGQQEQNGLSHTDVRSIYFASHEHRWLDTADFIGPLAIRDIPGAGRGLITTRNVEPGELLLTCRAIGSAYPDDDQSRGSPLVRLNVDTGVISSTSQVRAQTNLIHAIVDRGEELALPVLGLTAGPEKDYSEYVARPYPFRAVPDLQAASKYDAPRLDVDAAYVDGVLRFNAFGPAQTPARSEGKGSSEGGNPPRITGEVSELSKATMPHPLPAILNHACLPNVSSIFFSDIVTTRALARLPPDTEIVHQYVRGEEPYAIRASQLSKHGLECACTLCKLDRVDGVEAYTARARIVQGEARAVYERSRVLMKRIKVSAIGSSVLTQDLAATGVGDGQLRNGEDVEAHRDVLDALRNLVKRIDDTYAPSRGILRPERAPVLLIALKHVALVEGVQKAIESCTSALESIGASIDAERDDATTGVLIDLPTLHMDIAIQMLLFVAVLKANSAQRSEGEASNSASLAGDAAVLASQRWTKAAFYGHQCMIGGGRDVFLDRWSIEDFAPVLSAWKSE